MDIGDFKGGVRVTVEARGDDGEYKKVKEIVLERPLTSLTIDQSTDVMEKPRAFPMSIPQGANPMEFLRENAPDLGSRRRDFVTSELVVNIKAKHDPVVAGGGHLSSHEGAV